MKISNSQIMDWQKCPRRFYYAQILKLRPKDYPPALQRGLAGHALMEAFFKRALEGGDYDECVAATNPILADPTVLHQGGMDIYRHVLAYGAYFFSLPLKVRSVEINYLIETFDGNQFAFTPDLIAEWTSGPKRGQSVMIDFKFTGQFWNDAELGVYQQVPKYIRYYNKLTGEKLHNGQVVQLNTRAAQTATGTSLFRVSPVKITEDKLDRIELENIRLMEEVIYAKENYEEDDYNRTVDSYQCKMCFFASICAMDLEGRDSSKVRERAFTINTYFEDNYGDVDG
jgi:hypothetical protein